MFAHLSRSFRTSLAPFIAKRRAASRPIPLPAPVIIVTLPLKRELAAWPPARCFVTTAILFLCAMVAVRLYTLARKEEKAMHATFQAGKLLKN